MPDFGEYVIHSLDMTENWLSSGYSLVNSSPFLLDPRAKLSMSIRRSSRAYQNLLTVSSTMAWCMSPWRARSHFQMSNLMSSSAFSSIVTRRCIKFLLNHRAQKSRDGSLRCFECIAPVNSLPGRKTPSMVKRHISFITIAAKSLRAQPTPFTSLATRPQPNRRACGSNFKTENMVLGALAMEKPYWSLPTKTACQTTSSSMRNSGSLPINGLSTRSKDCVFRNCIAISWYTRSEKSTAPKFVSLSDKPSIAPARLVWASQALLKVFENWLSTTQPASTKF